MNTMLIPPREPQPVRPPMVYVERPVRWEYKQIARDLEKEGPFAEEELNQMGSEGWEMTGVAQQAPLAYYYFKRQIEK